MSRANGITRQAILTCIKSSGAMTAEELANMLNISQVAVRQHLASLEAENIITVSVERRGLGRPSHRYTLTLQGDETFPRSYDNLANSLLEELRAWQGDEAVRALFERQRERNCTMAINRLRDKPLPAKIHELAQIHTENGFMAEAHQVDEGTFQLIKRNCAFCAVARNHPQLCCKSEDEFYKGVLGDVEVHHEKSILEGDTHCSFHIRSCSSLKP